jgi:dihydrofolate synthase/folylpolyglutamate synthase
VSVIFEDLAAAYAWLDGNINYERLLDRVGYGEKTFMLERFAQRLNVLGDPQRGLRTVHIAGTRGKGSAALLLEALFHASGLRTAVYTSPHLREYRERVRIDGAPLSPGLLCELMGRIAEWNAAFPGQLDDSFATVFENLTALFFLAARRTAVDWCIVETGLGGRLDATNVLEPGPVLLTRIGLEHTRMLGRTHAAIAAEKAAILKPGGWAVTGAQRPGPADASSDDPGADHVFRDRARQTGARLDRAEELCPIRRIQAHPEGLRLTLHFEGQPLDLDLPLWGEFQAENIQNALAMLTRLRAEGLAPRVAPDALAASLRAVRIPGRMQRVCRAPELFADGGHCPTAAAALVRTMRAHFGDRPAGLLLGMMEDKDCSGILRELSRWDGWRWVLCYRGLGPRGLDSKELADRARPWFPEVVDCSTLQAALDLLPLRAEKVDRIVAMGSLYSVAAIEDWGAQRDGESAHQNKTSA